MAGNNDQVKYTDLFDSDITSGLNALKTALEEVVKQIAALKAEAQSLKKALGNANTATREQQQTTAADAAEAERLSRQIKELTTEEARLKAAIAEANRMTKLQGQAANAAEGSLNQMRARYKLLVAEMSNYNLKTEEGRRKMQSTAAQARKLRDEIYKLEASYGQFGRNVGNYTGALSRFGARLKEAAARFVAFNAAFLSATGLIRFGKALFEVRKELESTLVTYKALAGEMQGAKLFEEVKNFALTTPVTLNAASKAVQMMLSFGVAQDKVVDIMKRLGDISSADSERMQRLALAYSQATQAGRLMGQDTLQFINAGFNPLYYISLRTGESMESLRDQMKNGKIDIQQVTQAIIDATSEGGQFNGMLEKQRDTMKGAAAIMEGAWQNMLNEMGSDMESGIVGIIKWLTKLMQNWRETMRTMRQIAVSIGTAKAAMLLYKVAIDSVTKSQAAQAAATVAETTATNANTAATLRNISLKKVWTGVTMLAKNAVVALNAALTKFLPFAVIAGVTMLVQKLFDARREMEQLKDYTKEFAEVETEMNREMRKEINKLDSLFTQLKKAKKGTDEYKAAQQAIIDNFSKYNSTLSQELTQVGNLKTAYDNLATSIQNSYKAKARQSFMEKSETRLGESEAKLRQELNEFVEDYTDENGNWSTKRLKGGALPRAVYNNVQNYLQYGRWLDGQVASQIINGRLGWGNGGLGRAALQYQTALRAFKEANQRADALWGPYVEPTETGYTPVTTGGTDDGAGGKVHEQKLTDKYWEAEKALLEAQYEGYQLELKLAKLNRDKQRDELTNWYVDQRLALDENLKNGFITQEEYAARIIELDRQNTTLREGIDEQYWKDIRTLRSKNMKAMSDEWEANAKDNAKRELKAMVDGWQEQRAVLVAEGATRRKLIEAEVAAEIARLNLMLERNRDVNGEIMSDEQKAKVQEWINLLERLQQTGNYSDYKPGQFMGKGGANVTNERKRYSSTTQVVADVLGVDVTENQISDLNTVFDQAKGALNSWMDARKAAADQAKELADDEVAAAENALNREIELRNQGYANDVALREKELADAKANQKKAAEMQKKAQEDALLVNSAMEASSMAVAVANLFKDFPLYAAIPLTAVLLGSFAAAKIQAFQSIRQTKFKEGGVMLLEGGSHESGHDVNLGIGPDGSNLRAEGGEYFAVINKRSSRKYGSQIPAVVNAFNSGMFEDRYIKTSDAMGLMGNVGVVGNVGESADLSRLESGVGELVKQGEQNWTIEGGYRVLRYKNLTRRVKIG